MKDTNQEIENLKRMVSSGLVDKATLFGLLVTEFKQEFGEKALDVARKAAYKRGNALGIRIKNYMEEKGRNTNDLIEVRKSFAEMSGSTANRIDIDTQEKRLEYDVTFCPWVDAWKNAGFTEEQISQFCDIMSESDKALPKGINQNIELKNNQGLGKGKQACRVIWEINK